MSSGEGGTPTLVADVPRLPRLKTNDDERQARRRAEYQRALRQRSRSFWAEETPVVVPVRRRVRPIPAEFVGIKDRRGRYRKNITDKTLVMGLRRQRIKKQRSGWEKAQLTTRAFLLAPERRGLVLKKGKGGVKRWQRQNSLILPEKPGLIITPSSSTGRAVTQRVDNLAAHPNALNWMTQAPDGWWEHATAGQEPGLRRVGNTGAGKKARSVRIPEGYVSGRAISTHRNINQDPWNFSVREGGNVIGHALDLELDDVDFRVSEAGRRRWQQTGQKNPHALMHGTGVGQRVYERGELPEGLEPILYKPEVGHFFPLKDIKADRQRKLKRAKKIYASTRYGVLAGDLE